MSTNVASSKTKLFVSYSRKDSENVERLFTALGHDEDFTIFRDTDDILPTEEWKSRLKVLIKASDTLLFALTPNSITSEVCRWELEYAESFNKRIIPVVIEDIDGDVPEIVSKLNYIFLTESEVFDKVLPTIKKSISLDIIWIREHTRLGDLAERWEVAAKLGAQPLRGKELVAAENWLANQPKGAPAPTQIHRNYISNCRRIATKRQRMAVISSLMVLVIVGVLGIFAWQQRNTAVAGEAKAKAAIIASTTTVNTMMFDLIIGYEDSSVPIKIRRKMVEQVSALQATLQEGYGDDPSLLYSIAVQLTEQGALLMEAGHIDLAWAEFQKSLTIARQLASLDPRNLDWQNLESVPLIHIGYILRYKGHSDAALTHYEEALNIHRKLWSLEPDSTKRKVNVSRSIARIAGVKSFQGVLNMALRLYEEALEIQQDVSASEPTNTTWKADTATSMYEIANIKMIQGQSEAAHDLHKEALSIRQDLSASDPDRTDWKENTAISMYQIANIKKFQGQLEAALDLHKEALSIRQDLSDSNPDNRVWKENLSYSLHMIAIIKEDQGNLDAALNLYGEALNISRQVMNNANIIILLHDIASIKEIRGDFAAAFDLYEESLVINRQVVNDARTNTAFVNYLKETLGYIAWNGILIGRFERSELASLEAIYRSPDELRPYIHYAHTLMLQNNTHNAKMVYLSHRDKFIQTQKWENAVLEDFTILRNAGFKHPLMDEIEQLFKDTELAE